MPRAKKSTEPEVSANVAAEPKPAKAPARKRTAAVKTAAAAPHKHASKKNTSPVESPAEQPRQVTHEDIAQLAYSYWVARGYQGGSAHEDWLRAERELFEAAQNR